MNTGHVEFKTVFVRENFWAFGTFEPGRHTAFVLQVLTQSVIIFIMSTTPVGTMVSAVYQTRFQIPLGDDAVSSEMFS